MHHPLRAIVAASAFAAIDRRKIAGLYDHAAERHLRIAAECRGDWLQGRDGEREADFGGTLPNLYDAGERASISLEIAGGAARGYDHGSATFYDVTPNDTLVQLYDHGEGAWYAFTVTIAPQS